MSNEILIISRHEAPSIMDDLPYGTACKVLLDGKYDLWCQISKHEEEKPNWLFIGTFNDDKFIQEEINNIIGNK